MEETNITSIGEIVRKMEHDYLYGSTQLSDYVNYSMHDTLERIYAYLNSVHISGEFDAEGREKPFFNVVIATANIWMRATDIDRKDIKVRATKAKDWINSFLATVLLQDWMKRDKFGKYLNKWGRILSRYGSAVTKTVKNSTGLHITALPWSTIICDPIDFDNNPKIEILQLTEAQLWRRVKTHGYDPDAVRSLITAVTTVRTTAKKKRKDNKSGYIKLYEIHGDLQRSLVTHDEADDENFTQQVHVVSFVCIKDGRDEEYQDFTLFEGFEEKDPYSIAHLIEEDDRTLSIGPVEYRFTDQWMQNDSAKAIRDQLQIASKIAFQTSDGRFLGQNVLTDIENGSIFIHSEGEPVTRLDSGSQDIVSLQNYAVQWKTLGNEIAGISEAMLGANPKSGTAWRQTEAMLQEGYSLFELMTENKGLYLIDLLTDNVIPYLKTKIDTADEVSAILNQNDLDRIDSLYIKGFTVAEVNRIIKEKLTKGELVGTDEQQLMLAKSEGDIKEVLGRLGNQRFFKPSDISDVTWKEQFKDLEWDLDIDITGEQKNVQEALTTLNTAIQMMMIPGFEQNKKAQFAVGKVFELTGAMSPAEYNAIPADSPPQGGNGQVTAPANALPNNQQQ